ncbi:MAG: gamma-glutamylcyclotransferase [Gammaproteobacteria bacterium]|nr:gamma-glutamylcyclotransferase [Gammaproteobacteria bacterium]
MKVFFYGLFMDVDLLAKKGITPQVAVVGHVDGFSLHIGERATLLRSAGARAYGVMMEISSGEAKDLYAESSVADYVPKAITVELMDGSEVEASCYTLPDDKITETNKDYAKALLQVADKLGLPETYIAEITQACV